MLPTLGKWLLCKIRVCDGVNVSGCRNFAAAVILVKLLEMALRLLSRIPVIGGLNKILGTLLGLLVGFFWISLLSLILMAMAEYLSGSIPGLTPESFENTILAKFLYEKNIFRLLFEKLSAG